MPLKKLSFKKILTTFIIISMCVTPILSSASAKSFDINYQSKYASLNIPNSYLIAGVPYVSQETGYYCAYASATMIFKYLGINTSLSEVLYITGVGYTTGYKGIENGSLGVGVGICREFNFISSLYNLSRKTWYLNVDGKPKDVYWSEYWIRVKQNISRNIPVRTSVDSLYLKSLRDIFNINDQIFDKILKIISMNSSHVIVITGYNESNNTVCFNDPIIGVFGCPENGTYVWMNLSDYKRALFSAADCAIKYNLNKHIMVETYQKISDPPSKYIIFEKAHQRNIERMKGNLSAYKENDVIDNMSKTFHNLFGVKSLERLKEDFKPGIKSRFLTMLFYKKQNIGIRFMVNLCKLCKPDFVPDRICEEQFIKPYLIIIMDKNYNLQYLHDNIDLLPINKKEITLFEKEMENWTELNEHYNAFVDKGLRLCNIKGLFSIYQMGLILDNIIEIQREIVSEQ